MAALEKRSGGAAAGAAKGDVEMTDESANNSQAATAGAGIKIGGNSKEDVSNDDDMRAALAFIKE